MKRYPAYKDSGVEWIGALPIDWNNLKIKWLSPVKRGASPRPIDDPKYFDDDGEFAWVRIADVTASKRYLKRTTQTLSELGSSLSVKRYPGDLFVSIAGTVGKPIITKIKCCIHDGFVYFPLLKVSPDFFYYMLTAGTLFNGLGKWGTQLNLNTETVGDIYVPRPSDVEIKAIVKYLNHKTHLIDTLIKKKQKQIELLQEQRAAIINQAVTKGLNPNVKMKDSGIGWLGEVPEHWQKTRIKYIASVRGRIGFRGYTTEDQVEEGQGALTLGATQIDKNGFIDLSRPVYLSWDKFNESPEIMLTKGDILIVQRGSTCGKIGILDQDIGEATINPSLIVLKELSIHFKFLFYFLTSSFLQKNLDILLSSTAIPMLSQEQINNLPILVPNEEDLRDILNYLDKATKDFNKMVLCIDKEIEYLLEYRTTLISEVVTGKIDARDEAIP